MTRWLVTLVLLVLGCVGQGPEKEGGANAEREESAAFGIGFLQTGEMVAFDVTTGGILGQGPPSTAPARDLAWDESASVLYKLEEAEDGSSSELFQCEVDVGAGTIAFGACSHAAWVDGIAALAPARRGVWVFEDGEAGPRWKVLKSGAISQGAYAPRPASLWQSPTDPMQVRALSYGPGEDALSFYAAAWSGSGLAVKREPVELFAPHTFPPTARWTPRPLEGDEGAGLLWDLVDAELAVAEVRDSIRGAFLKRGIKPPAARIDAALDFSGAGLGLSLVASADRVWVLDPTNERAEPVERMLQGTIRPAREYFSHDIAMLGERAWIATGSGLRLLVASKGLTGPRAFLDERFSGDALRGPLLLIRHRRDTESIEKRCCGGE